MDINKFNKIKYQYIYIYYILKILLLNENIYFQFY